MDPLGSGPVVPDLAWRRNGKTCGTDIHAHSCSYHAVAHPIAALIETHDRIKCEGRGSMEAARAQPLLHDQLLPAGADA